MSASSHSSTPGINHETDQEPIKWVKLLLELVGEYGNFIAGIFNFLAVYGLIALIVRCTIKISMMFLQYMFYRFCGLSSLDSRALDFKNVSNLEITVPWL